MAGNLIDPSTLRRVTELLADVDAGYKPRAAVPVTASDLRHLVDAAQEAERLRGAVERAVSDLSAAARAMDRTTWTVAAGKVLADLKKVLESSGR